MFSEHIMYDHFTSSFKGVKHFELSLGPTNNTLMSRLKKTKTS